jgi:hypothetical protein
MEPRKSIRIEELEREHPLRQLPYTVPEDYFDKLPSQIQAKATQRPQERSVISWSWQRSVTALAGAGLVAALVWITYPQKQEALGPDMLSEVSNRAIADYLSEQDISDFDLTDIHASAKAAPGDSTLLQFLDVSPKSIRQLLESEPIVNETI